MAEQKLQEQKQQVKKLKAYFETEPAADAQEIVQITFRIPSGQRVSRRFLASDTMKTLFNYIRTLENLGFENSLASFEVFTLLPKKIFEESDLTLKEVGIYPKPSIL